MAQQMQQAQALSMQMGLMPQMPQMNLAAAAHHPGSSGIYGEQVANRMAGAAKVAGTVGSLGLGLAGGAMGIPLDPFSGALAAGRAGYASAGWSGAAMGAVGGAMPFLAAGALASVYTGAFSGGMREQAATNSMLRSSFNFQGGQGAFGRGFDQGQMGQVGHMISQEARRSPFTSSSELNQLIQGGQESGMFNAVRDVESFSRKFRTMIDGLRKIQKELGGTLSEALQFTRGTQQLGIFSTGGRTAFAAEMRDTMSVTGMDQNQIFSLASTGSMLSRATGGVGRQGAMGALRTARTLGAALTTGAINQEGLSEATGGLQGQEAIQAFTARTLQMTDRFSRSARGRYSLFALANEQGTGMSQEALDRFRVGDLSVGGVMRDAHTRVNRLGRARALNQEGRLRGAMMEEGGMSAQIGMMRLQLGDRVLDSGDDVAQLVMQRRMGLSQSESQVWSSLMRNQRSIAATETVDRAMGKEQVARERDLALNRSVEAFTSNLSHGLQDAAGVTAARDMGRRFLTKISSAAEKTLNDFLGIQADAMSVHEKQAMTRLGMGMATGRDRLRLSVMGGQDRVAGPDMAFTRSQGNELLHSMGFHTTQTYSEMMKSRGVDIRGMSPERRAVEERRRLNAQKGLLDDVGDQRDLHRLQVRGDTLQRFTAGMAAGDRESLHGAFKGIASSAAVDAYGAGQGFLTPADDFAMGQSRGGGGRRSMYGMIGDIAAGVGSGAFAGGTLGMALGGPIGTAVGAVAGGLAGLGLGVSAAMQGDWGDRDKALDFIARGGHMGKRARVMGEVARYGGEVTDKRMSMGEGVAWDKVLKQGVPREAIASVLESDAFKTGLTELKGAKTAAQREVILNNLRREANSITDPDQKRAAALVTGELGFNLRTGKTGLQMGKEFSHATQDERKRAEVLAGYGKIGAAYDEMRDKMPDSPFSTVLKGVRDAAMAANRDLPGTDLTATYDAVSGGISQATAMLAKMGDSERSIYTEFLGRNEMGRGILQSSAADRATIREFTGKGRRGRAGAADSVMGALTGDTLGSMSFELDGKQLSSRRASRILYGEFRKGGEVADQLGRQLVSQMQEKGISGAEAHVKEVMESIKKNDVSPEEATKLLDKLKGNETINAARTKQMAATQAANNPLDATRNDLLRDIRTGINVIAKIDTETNQSLPVSETKT